MQVPIFDQRKWARPERHASRDEENRSVSAPRSACVAPSSTSLQPFPVPPTSPPAAKEPPGTRWASGLPWVGASSRDTTDQRQGSGDAAAGGRVPTAPRTVRRYPALSKSAQGCTGGRSRSRRGTKMPSLSAVSRTAGNSVRSSGGSGAVRARSPHGVVGAGRACPI